MKKLLLVTIVASTLVLSGCTWNKQSTTDTVPSNVQPETTNTNDTMPDNAMMGTGTTGEMMEKQAETMEKEAMMKKDEMVQEAVMKNDPASYIPYNEMTAKSLLTAGKKVVLFFHAGRCPSCKSLDRELNEKIASLPENTVVLKVDYDNSTDLKKKYEVTSQHTLVHIDTNMNLVAKQRGGDASAVAKLLQ